MPTSNFPCFKLGCSKWFKKKPDQLKHMNIVHPELCTDVHPSSPAALTHLGLPTTGSSDAVEPPALGSDDPSFAPLLGRASLIQGTNFTVRVVLLLICFSAEENGHEHSPDSFFAPSLGHASSIQGINFAMLVVPLLICFSAEENNHVHSPGPLFAPSLGRASSIRGTNFVALVVAPALIYFSAAEKSNSHSQTARGSVTVEDERPEPQDGEHNLNEKKFWGADDCPFYRQYHPVLTGRFSSSHHVNV
jgi:hypothetical protein